MICLSILLIDHICTFGGFFSFIRRKQYKTFSNSNNLDSDKFFESKNHLSQNLSSAQALFQVMKVDTVLPPNQRWVQEVTLAIRFERYCGRYSSRVLNHV